MYFLAINYLDFKHFTYFTYFEICLFSPLSMVSYFSEVYVIESVSPFFYGFIILYRFHIIKIFSLIFYSLKIIFLMNLLYHSV